MKEDIVLIGDHGRGRYFAAVIDNLIALVISFLGASRLPESTPVSLRGLVLVGLYLGYHFILETICQTTLGKRVMNLHVVRLNGSTPSTACILTRTLLRIVEANPLIFGYLPGAVSISLTRYHQRLGDLLAGTVVVSLKEVEKKQNSND